MMKICSLILVYNSRTNKPKTWENFTNFCSKNNRCSFISSLRRLSKEMLNVNAF